MSYSDCPLVAILFICLFELSPASSVYGEGFEAGSRHCNKMRTKVGNQIKTSNNHRGWILKPKVTAFVYFKAHLSISFDHQYHFVHFFKLAENGLVSFEMSNVQKAYKHHYEILELLVSETPERVLLKSPPFLKHVPSSIYVVLPSSCEVRVIVVLFELKNREI
jgi:hypothetical protein